MNILLENGGFNKLMTFQTKCTFAKRCVVSAPDFFGDKFNMPKLGRVIIDD